MHDDSTYRPKVYSKYDPTNEMASNTSLTFKLNLEQKDLLHKANRLVPSATATR